MYCPNCAAPIDGSKFCRSCGANVSLIPQALSGQLPQAPAPETHGHGRRRHRVPKEPSIEKAMSSLFTGIGFILAGLFVLFRFPGGFTWGWAMFIPGFACIGEGVGQYLRLQEQRRQQQFNPPASSHTPMPPAPPAAGISAPTTSELRDPSSITEHTTRHLDTSQSR